MPVMLKKHAYVKVQNRALDSNVTDKMIGFQMPQTFKKLPLAKF